MHKLFVVCLVEVLAFVSLHGPAIAAEVQHVAGPPATQVFAFIDAMRPHAGTFIGILFAVAFMALFISTASAPFTIRRRLPLGGRHRIISRGELHPPVQPAE